MFKDEGLWKSYQVVLTIHIFDNTVNLRVSFSEFNHEQVEEVKRSLRVFLEMIKGYLEVPFNELPLFLPLKSNDGGIPDVIVYGRLKAGF